MDRRSFLKAAAAAPCIFGLGRFIVQEADAKPEWFRQALARMKERNLHGVVLIAPERDPEQRDFGARLWDLLASDPTDAHELFLTGVFVVMTPAVAESSGLRKADEKENRFLLDPDGKRIAADASEAKSFDSGAAFAAAFTPFLHGESGERLKARATEAGAGAPVDVRRALVDLGADEIESRDRASAVLLERAGPLIPLYAWKRRSATDPEVAARLRSIVHQHYKTVASDRPGPRLPFGSRLPQFRNGGCGDRREVVENEPNDPGPMVACGMGRIDNVKARMFLRFLSK